MDTAPFQAPDPIAQYLEPIVRHLTLKPGRTVSEIREDLQLGENTTREALARLGSLDRVHCRNRLTGQRGLPACEYYAGPLPRVS